MGQSVVEGEPHSHLHGRSRSTSILGRPNPSDHLQMGESGNNTIVISAGAAMRDNQFISRPITTQSTLAMPKLPIKTLRHTKLSVSLGVPLHQPSVSRSPSPPALTPGSTPGSSTSSSTASSRCSSPSPLTPAAAQTEFDVNKMILSPKFSTNHVSAVGTRELLIDQECCPLFESSTFCQPAHPVSLKSLPGQQLGSEVGDMGVHFTSRDKKACHSKVFRMETNEGEEKLQVGLGPLIPSSRAEGRCVGCGFLGESSYEKSTGNSKELNMKGIVLSDGSRPISGKDREFLMENDLANTLMYLVGGAKWCSTCKSCRICTENKQFMSSEESQQAQLYKEQLVYDPIEKRISTNFLFYDKSKHGCVLGQYGDHCDLALTRNKKMEKRILREYSSDTATIQNFNDEIGCRLKSGEILTFDQCEKLYGKPFLETMKYFHPLSYAKRNKLGHAIRPIVDTAVQDPVSKRNFNDHLLCGPSLNSHLVHTWFTVRNHKYLAISDLDKYFNTVKLFMKSQALSAFHWRVNGEAPGYEDGVGSSFPYTKCLSTRLTFGQKCSPYLAAESLKMAMGLFCKLPENKSSNFSSLYVDDYIAHSDDVPSLYLRIADLCESLKEASFTFKKWDFSRSAEIFWIPQFQTMLDKGVKIDERLMRKYLDWKMRGSPKMEVENPCPNRVKFDNRPPIENPCQDRVKQTLTCQSPDVVIGPFEDSEVMKFLGAFFHLKLDLYKPSIRFNLSKRSRGCKQQKFDITLDNIEEMLRVTFPLTLRRCLSLVHACYDNVGVSQCLVFTLKYLYSQLLLKHKDDDKFGYDSFIDKEDVQNWIDAVKEVLKLQNYWFQRSLQPEDMQNYLPPFLVGFFDGSSFGSSTALYYLYEAKDHSHCEGRLIFASGHVAGLNLNTTIPDQELTGLLSLAVITNSLKKAKVLLPTRKEYFVGDSLVALKICQKPSISLAKNLATKVCRIKTLIDTSSLRFTKSSLNCSDILSRPGCTVAQVLSKHFQNAGPLTGKVEDWQIFNPNDERCTKLGDPSKISPENLMPTPKYKVIEIVKGSIKKLSDLEDELKLVEDDVPLTRALRHNVTYLKRVPLQPEVKGLETWSSVLNQFKLGKAARILLNCFYFAKMVTKKLSLLEAALAYPNALDLIMEHLEREASKVSGVYLRKVSFGLQRNIEYDEKSEKYVYRERFIDQGAETPLVRHEMVFMTLASSYFRSFLAEAHICATRDVRLAQLINQKFICRYLEKGLAKVRRNCYKCIKNQASKEKYQKVHVPQGPLPSVRIENHPPFSFVAFDTTAGKKCQEPSEHVFDVSVEEQKYTKVVNKLYVANFTCLSSGAVNLLALPNLKTESIIKCFQIHQNQRGCFSELHSDLYSSLLSAYRILSSEKGDNETETSLIQRANKVVLEVVKWCHGNKARYNNPAARASHIQGTVERKFAYVNDHIIPKLHTHKLDLFDLQALLSQLCTWLNSLPVYLAPPNTGFAVTRQQLLVGCAFRPSFSSPTDDTDKLLGQFKATENYRMRFFEYLHSQNMRRLLENKTWSHTNARQHKVGDVIILRDRLSFSHLWFGLGLVLQVLPSKDEQHRRCVIGYTLYNEGFMRKTTRHSNTFSALVPVESSEQNFTINSIFAPDEESLENLLSMPDTSPSWEGHGLVEDGHEQMEDDYEQIEDDGTEPNLGDEENRLFGNEDILENPEPPAPEVNFDESSFNQILPVSSEQYQIDEDVVDDGVENLAKKVNHLEVEIPRETYKIKNLPEYIHRRTGEEPISTWSAHNRDPVLDDQLEAATHVEEVQDSVLQDVPVADNINNPVHGLGSKKTLFLKSMRFYSHCRSSPPPPVAVATSTTTDCQHSTSMLTDNLVVNSNRITQSVFVQLPTSCKEAKHTLVKRRQCQLLRDSFETPLTTFDTEVTPPRHVPLPIREKEVLKPSLICNKRLCSSKTVKLFIILVIIINLFSGVSSCWMKHSMDPEVCEAELRPNLVLLTQQYQSFLEAIKHLQEIDKEKVESVDFLGRQAIIYSTEYLESIKNDFTNNVVPTQYSDIVAHCLKTSLTSVNFRRNQKMELFSFIKRHKLDQGFCFSVKAVSEHMIVFSSNFQPTGYGYKFKTELNSFSKRSAIQFAVFNQGSTEVMEEITLVNNVFGNSYIPVVCMTTDEETAKFLRFTNDVEEFLLKNNNFSSETSHFEKLMARVETLSSKYSTEACTGSLVDILSLHFVDITPNIKYYNVAQDVKTFLKQLVQVQSNLELSEDKLKEAEQFINDTFPPTMNMVTYITWLFSIIKDNYQLEMILSGTLTLILCTCCCGCCQLLESCFWILSLLAKVIICVFSWTVIAPLARGLQGLREIWLNYRVPSSEELELQPTQNSVRRLNHSLLTFNPVNRNFNTNLMRNRNQDQLGFVLPTLSELQRYEQQRNQQNTESRFTEVV